MSASVSVPDPVNLSEEFLLAVRNGDTTGEFERRLADFDSRTLAARLDTDDARLAFWVNVYNAATQGALVEDPEQYDDRRTFFSSPVVTVAGERLSLDDIEHGILRRSYPKFGLGYVPNPLCRGFEKRHAPGERDPRIHFALNCGAESCPPIAAYTRQRVDDQLDWATESYLEQTVEYDPDANRVRVPRMMLWFRGDFGRKRDILAFLRRYDQLPGDASPRLSYREWSWSLAPEQYAEEEQAPAGGRE